MRPPFDAAGLPAFIRAAVIAKAARQWCYVTPDGRPFYVTREQAEAMRAKSGGAIYAPEVQ